VPFLEGRLLSIQSEQSEKFSKSPDWLEKAGPSKKPLLFGPCKQAINAFFHLGPINLLVVMAQPNKRHPNRTASALCWSGKTHRA